MLMIIWHCCAHEAMHRDAGEKERRLEQRVSVWLIVLSK